MPVSRMGPTSEVNPACRTVPFRVRGNRRIPRLNNTQSPQRIGVLVHCDSRLISADGFVLVSVIRHLHLFRSGLR